MKTYARLVGSYPTPPRWWQFVPPWCQRKPAVPVAWSSYPVPFLLDGEKQRAFFPPARLTNASTMVWSVAGWPKGLEIREVHIETETGILLFHAPLDWPRKGWVTGDTVSIPAGGFKLEID